MINQNMLKTDYSKANSIKLDELHALILSLKTQINTLKTGDNTDLSTIKDDILNGINSALDNLSFDGITSQISSLENLVNMELLPKINECNSALKSGDINATYLNVLSLLIKTEEILNAIANIGGGGSNIDLSAIEDKLNLLQSSINDIASKLGSDSSGLDPELPYEPAPDKVYQTHHKKIVPCNYVFSKPLGSFEEELYFQNDGVPSIMQLDYDIVSNLDIDFTVEIKINDNVMYTKLYSIPANTTTHLTHFATYISTTTQNKVLFSFTTNQANSITFSNIEYNLTADNAFFIHYTPKYDIASLQNNYYICKYENHKLSYITTPANNIDLTSAYTNLNNLKASYRYKPYALLIYTNTTAPTFSTYSAAAKDTSNKVVGICTSTNTFTSFKGSTYSNVVDFDICSYICAQSNAYFAYIDGATNTLYTKQVSSSKSVTAIGSYTPLSEGKLLSVYLARNHSTHSNNILLDCFVVATYSNGDNYIYNKTLNISHNLGKGTKISVSIPYYVNNKNTYLRVLMCEVDHWVCKVLRFTGTSFEVLDYFNINQTYEEMYGGMYDDYFTYQDNQLVRHTFSETEHSLDKILN